MQASSASLPCPRWILFEATDLEGGSEPPVLTEEPFEVASAQAVSSQASRLSVRTDLSVLSTN